MPAPNVGDMIATTLEYRSKTIADNVTANNALLGTLRAKNKVAPVDGGHIIFEPLSYAENSTYRRYSGYEILDIDPSDVIDTAQYPFRQVAVAVTQSGLETLQNAGKSAMISLIKSKVDVAESTMMNGLSGDLYSDGTADSGKQINGIQAVISTAPSAGTVGGINRANYMFWRNQVETAAATLTADTIGPAMNKLWVKQVRNQDMPDLIASGNDMYNLYLEGLQDKQRFADRRMAGLGFQSVLYKTAPVVLDGGLDGSCPANRMYMINCKYLRWRPHSDRNMVAMGPDRHSTNQDATVKLLGFAGNLCASNCSLQGVLVNV